MNIEKSCAFLMSMSDDVWMRHANPISVWTRICTFPFFFFAVWSYVWIGWFFLLAIGIVSLWAWLNPRLFRKPKTTKTWSSMGVLGERVWLNRKSIPIPNEHEQVINILLKLSAIGICISVYGFIAKNFWAAFMGWNCAVMAKIWFFDRMVWLYQDMKDKNAEYRSWFY